MGLLSWIGAGPRQQHSSEAAKERRLWASDGLGLFFGGESKAGKRVTVDTAMQLATVWACIRLTALAVSSLPIGVYEKRADGSRIVRDDHPLAPIIESDPNSDQTSLEYWESMVAYLTAKGNAYSEITRTAGVLSALSPPLDARPARVEGELVYRVNDRGKVETLPREKVFHLKGFGFGGDEGLSPIRYGVQTMGSAIAADETAAKIFANGLQQPLFIDSGQARLNKDQRKDLTDLFKKFVGSDNTGKVMVLEAGMKPVPLSLNPEDAQMLATRQFNVEEECRWFGVPPIIVGHAAEGQTMWGSGVEQILLAWLALGINPACKRIEQRIRKQLLLPQERRRIYAEFNREGLLQMDTKAKSEFLSSMTQNGLMTRNEGRAKLNLPRVDGGDVLTAQTNLAPLDQLGATATPAS